MRAIISLTTDFGLDDPYVGAMKAAILGLNPDATLVDICHDVPPGDIALAGIFLAGAAPFFPPQAVHLAVVDPGVGSSRRCLAVRTSHGFFVAPDNGLLTAVLAAYPPEEVVALQEANYWLPSRSATFHGRDIMGPVAAHISLGLGLDKLGPPATGICTMETPQPYRQPNGAMAGQVIHIDRFGNLITNLASSHLEAVTGGHGTRLVFELCGQHIRGLSRHYAERTGLLALMGSTGLVEIAWRDGSAARTLGASRGDTVLVRAEWEGGES